MKPAEFYGDDDDGDEQRVQRVLTDDGQRASWLADLRELVDQAERAVEVYAQVPWPHDADGRRVRSALIRVMLELAGVSEPLGELYDAGRQTAEERALDDRIFAVEDRYDALPGVDNLSWEVQMLVESVKARRYDDDE